MLTKILPVLAVCLMLNGCYSSNGEIRLFNRYSLYGKNPSVVTVEKGDTLYSISRRYDVPLKDLIQQNGLRPPYNLKVGQSLQMPSAKYHIVQKGDTLYSISRQYNLDVASLSQKNRLKPPYALNIGQKLALPGTVSGGGKSLANTKVASSAASQTKVKPVQQKKNNSKSFSTVTSKRSGKFQWPVNGRVISGFGVIGKGRKNDGINISAAKGTAVKAADRGTVAYAGNELKGFGNLILVKHPDGWITAYAHNEKLLVRKGQKVIKGEKIATVGSTGGVNSPQLHFEVRAGKKAVNPRLYLP